MNLTHLNKDDLATALQMRINYLESIETSNSPNVDNDLKAYASREKWRLNGLKTAIVEADEIIAKGG